MLGMLGFVSVFVAVVLGLLIVYANNFLINRRKKEFGLYMTLGMSKRQISKVILLETIFVGIISLAARACNWCICITIYVDTCCKIV